VVLVLLRDTLVTATEVSSGFSPWMSVGSMSQPVSITHKIIAEKHIDFLFIILPH
jgi:hypothetical protein